MTADKVDRIIAQWRGARPELDPSPMAVPGRMARLAAHLQREIRAPLAALGIPPGGFDVLATLRRAAPLEGMSAGDLLGWMMVTSGTLTHRLDQLERLGWLERCPNPTDRRSVLVALTPEGRTLIDRAVEIHLENERRLLAPLSPEQREVLDGLLKAWLGAFE